MHSIPNRTPTCLTRCSRLFDFFSIAALPLQFYRLFTLLYLLAACCLVCSCCRNIKVASGMDQLTLASVLQLLAATCVYIGPQLSFYVASAIDMPLSTYSYIPKYICVCTLKVPPPHSPSLSLQPTRAHLKYSFINIYIVVFFVAVFVCFA